MKHLILIALLIFATTAFDCGGGSSSGSNNSNLPVKMPAHLEYGYVTPTGINVYSVVPIPEDKQAQVFAAIERGIETQINTSSAHNPTWRSVRQLSDYRLAFIAPDATNQDGSPALLYRGQIQTAGTVLGVGGDGFSPAMIILPHQGNQNWEHLNYLENSARNESEHFAEWFNDQNIFQQFAVAADVHPHWRADGE